MQHAYFRKVLKLDPRTSASVGIQVQGDTHVKIYVNGTEVGEQFVRRNLVGADQSQVAGRLRHQAAAQARR